MSKLLPSFFRPTYNNKNNNNFNFTLKARLNRSLNTLRKKSKETLKRKKNRGRIINSPMYPYGSNQNFESSQVIYETNNPLVQHTLGRKLYTACINEKYDIAQRLIDDIIKTDKTQLDYIGEYGTPLIVVATSIHRQVEPAADPSYNIKEGIQLINTRKPDLIIMDVMMPRKDGLQACREIRNAGNSTPLILLTARSSEIDKVLGLELGADDYLGKPFGMLELIARVKADPRTSSTSADNAISNILVTNIRLEIIQNS